MMKMTMMKMMMRRRLRILTMYKELLANRSELYFIQDHTEMLGHITSHSC